MTRAVMLEQKYLHIDGYQNIISFDDNCIRIDCKTKILEVLGKKLFIDSFTGIEMTVSGKIENLNWIGKGKENAAGNGKKGEE